MVQGFMMKEGGAMGVYRRRPHPTMESVAADEAAGLGSFSA